MKRLLRFFVISFAYLAVAACGNDNSEPVAERTGDILVANLEQVQTTRANLSDCVDGRYDVQWSASDPIALVGKAADGNAKTAKFTLSEGSGTNVGTFKGNIADAGTGPYLAIFPYTADARFDNGDIVFPISQRKGAQQGNVPTKTLPMISRVDGGATPTVTMNNLFGLLKITIRSAEKLSVKKITLRDLGGNMLWGDCRVPLDAEGNPQYDKATLENGTNSIDMVWNSPASITASTAKSFMMTVPAGALDQGFSIVVYESDKSQPDTVGRAYTFLQKVSSPLAVQRSMVLDMNEVTLVNKAERFDVNGRGYYKSLFVDAGYKLSNNYTTAGIPAISYLGLGDDYEYISVTEEGYSSTQVAIFAGGVKGQVNWQDANGVLLYPDGEPRFRTMYVNGGRSEDHGYSLTKAGLDAVNKYYNNGGSYVGTCAGSFLAVTYVDGTRRYGNANSADDRSFGLFPGQLTHTSLPPSITTWPTVYTGMAVLPALQELGAEYGFKALAELDTIEDTRHHGGSYYPHIAKNKSYKVEELLSYQYSDHHSAKDTSCYTYNNSLTRAKFQKKNGTPIDIVDSVSTWAYKTSAKTGRIVLTGSHPEKQKLGTQRDFMAFMLAYSMAGNGAPSTKATLTLGTTRNMNKATSANSPSTTMIGDRQYHHFLFKTTEDIENFQVKLDSQYDAASGVDLYLSLRNGDFAWISDAEYLLCNKGGQKTLNVKKLPAGTWYIGVFCATTVDATVTESDPLFFKYSGNVNVLDGVAYSIGVSKATKASDARSSKSSPFDFDL
ncbi:MAG: hypothetical protein MJY60_06575 [Bacteroidales bacterium]|nr:hypothetical protein [Bacteroidales bacterium]